MSKAVKQRRACNPVAKALSNPVCRPQTFAARKGAGSYRRKARTCRTGETA